MKMKNNKSIEDTARLEKIEARRVLLSNISVVLVCKIVDNVVLLFVRSVH